MKKMLKKFFILCVFLFSLSIYAGFNMGDVIGFWSNCYGSCDRQFGFDMTNINEHDNPEQYYKACIKLSKCKIGCIDDVESML